METLASYPSDWIELKRRRRDYLVVGFGSIVAIVAVVGLLILLSLPLAVGAFIIGVIGYIIGFATVAFRLQNFRCPRCERLFSTAFSSFPFGPIAQHACAHCGLRANI